MKQIELTRGFVALVDDEDYSLVYVYKWHVTPAGYAMNRGKRIPGQKREAIMMHRLITNAPKGLLVDHKNHNRLDNRRENLRVCSYSDNGKNRRKKVTATSKYKGVSFHSAEGKWRASICITGNSRSTELGHFYTEIEAARAYNEAAQKHYGEFAHLNQL